MPQSEPEFIPGAYYELGKLGWVAAAWSEAGRLVVRLPPVRAEAASPAEAAVPVRRGYQTRVQELLRQITLRTTAEQGSYVLDLTPPSGGGRRLVWSAGDEVELLAQLRLDVEEMAHLAYYQARLALLRGRAEAQSGDSRKAAELFRIGLEILGARYVHPGLIDDTAMKLALARDHDAGGRLAQAAAVYDRVLDSRLQVYAERNGLARQN